MSVWGWVGIGLASAFLLLVIVLLLRAGFFRGGNGKYQKDVSLDINPEKAVLALQALVQCKTVSSPEKDKEKEEEFTKLKAVLQRFYPNVYSHCDVHEPSSRVIIFHLSGSSNDKIHAAIFTAHFDVVPAETSQWSVPPFSGIRKEGFLYGRGTIDTKGTLNGILEAAEELLAKGFVPRHDFYFCFAGDEEISGGSARVSVAYLKDKGIDPLFLFDEGGAVLHNAFPGLSQPAALIGIAEKGVCSMECHLDGEGGHARAPQPHSPVGKLASLAVDIEKHPFAFHWNLPVIRLFDTLGKHTPFAYRIFFANARFFTPLLNVITRKKGGQFNALFRTTTALTMMEGSPVTNVIPSKAMIGVNIRIAPSESVQSVRLKMEKLAKKHHLENGVRFIFGWEPSPVSTTEGEGYEKIAKAVHDTWGSHTLVSPYLMTACADAHLYNSISNKVYRFSPIHLEAKDLEMIHGDNERLSEKQISETVSFYFRLMKSL